MTYARMSQTDAAAIAADAYVFGYPLVLGDRMRSWMTEVRAPDPTRMRAPVNEFAHARELPEATAERPAAPYADSLRSTAWLDLADGPVLLTVPETHGHYYALSMVDLWTNAFASVGPRTTGSASGAYAVVGPGDHEAAIEGARETVPAPTRIVRIAGVTRVDGEDRLAEAHAVQDGFRLARPAGRAGGGRPGRAAAAGRTARRTPPVGQVERMDARTFFGELARLMRDNPPRPQDRPIVERLRELGLLDDVDDGWTSLDRALRSALARGMDRGLGRVVRTAEAPPGEAAGSWHIRFRLGEFGTDYLARAGAACAGLESGPAADELPALLEADAEGRPLWGRHHYVLRFPPDAQPPVHGFWTLTTYDDRQWLVDNPTDRYSIGDWNGLTLAGDGSVAIHIQHQRPAGDRRMNWLPAPPGRFNLLLRLVWPLEEVLDRQWTPPPVARIG